MVVLMGVDATRPMAERARTRLAARTCNLHTVDTAGLSLPGIPAQLRGEIGPIVLETVGSRLSRHYEAVRGASLDRRRYTPPTLGVADEARALRASLAAIYGPEDPLPDTAGGWVARQRSADTRKAYARCFRVWESYARSCGVHPLQAGLPVADAYARHIEVDPTGISCGLAADPA
ncbi:hypothetical protein [Kitasatospora sp. GP82]|uniref:hypothetical protein n=1 Tax=Kitasatospora sp. GP82 TaxID=3035089 RepID=UPI0024744D57|nr:hypothetical protein [Kitasatospora sp. GP82]MDH6129244.1 hypothetical protein [Kitasatospora sp. GP82]